MNQLDNNTYPVFEDWAVELLLDWCEQDPVSEKEINRNNEIYKIQGNRNPYIDFPLMAEYVWGKLKDVPFTPDGSIDFPYLSAPTNKSTLDFGPTAYQKTQDAVIHIKGVNLEGDLSVSITGSGAAFFSAANSIPKEDAENGYDLTVQFSAEEIGEKTAQLNLSGGGISGTTVILKALSTDNFMALPATYVSSTGFTANWTVSASASGYLVDVYSMQNDGKTESSIILEEDFNNGLPPGWTKTGYAEKEDGSSIRLASGKNPGSIGIPAFDLSGRKASLTVRAKQYREDTNAELTATLNNQNLVVWETDDEYEEYGIDITNTDLAAIKLSAQKGSRIFVDYVKIEALGSADTPVSIAGYPKTVSGGTLSLTVAGLEKDALYYYTVTPLGNSAAVSNEISVHTSANGTGEPEAEEQSINWFISSGAVHIQNLPEASEIKLFDLTGKQLYAAGSNSPQAQIKLPRKGIYLLQIIQDNSSKAYKILY